jgi:hypothetical protein
MKSVRSKIITAVIIALLILAVSGALYHLVRAGLKAHGLM